MKKAIHELTEQEYLEEIRKARSSQPEMTREQIRKQFHAMKASRRSPQLANPNGIPSP